MPPVTSPKTAQAVVKPNRPIVARAALEGFGEDDPELGWEQTPLYRVIEIVRDGDGRLRSEGRIWHTDLDHLRRFGRAMASNAASHKVFIADVRGDVIEELPIVSPEQRQTVWGDWQDMPLPPRPEVRRSARPAKPAPARRAIPILADPPVESEATLAPASEALLAVDTDASAPQGIVVDVEVLLP